MQVKVPRVLANKGGPSSVFSYSGLCGNFNGQEDDLAGDDPKDGQEFLDSNAVDQCVPIPYVPTETECEVSGRLVEIFVNELKVFFIVK